jgi:hypothetical protein
MRHFCDGGPTGAPCQSTPIWRVREDRHDYNPKSPYADRAWAYACGRHLHFSASEITGGEQMKLVLEQIYTKE